MSRAMCRWCGGMHTQKHWQWEHFGDHACDRSISVWTAGNKLGVEGSAAIGDGIKSCPQLTWLDLSSNLMGPLEGHAGAG